MERQGRRQVTRNEDLTGEIRSVSWMLVKGECQSVEEDGCE